MKIAVTGKEPSITGVLRNLIHKDSELRQENFKMKVNVINQLANEKHDERNNRMIAPYAIGNTFTKAGVYILCLGAVSFLEVFSTNLLCFVYCYFLENEMTDDYKAGNRPEPDLIEQNYFIILTIASVLGNLVFSAYVTAISLMYPFMPVFLQFVNTCLWILNVWFWFV